MFEIFEDDFGFHFRLSRNQKIHHYADHWKPVADPVHHLGGGGGPPKCLKSMNPLLAHALKNFPKFPILGRGNLKIFQIDDLFFQLSGPKIQGENPIVPHFFLGGLPLPGSATVGSSQKKKTKRYEFEIVCFKKSSFRQSTYDSNVSHRITQKSR